MRRFLTLLVTLLVFGAGSALGQVKQVSGVVTSADDKQPIPGASVFVKEAPTVGTSTDINGKYTLKGIPANAKTIVFRFVGYSTLEMPIKAELSPSLQSETQKIDEVVVTAMGISKEKKALAYAVQDVKADELTKGANTNLASALQGKVSGVEISPSSGMPGASAKMTIRGSRSFTGDNSPLYIVDGMPITSTSDMSTGNSVTGTDFANRSVDLDPNDIENINVLKGQAASALYGMRASNGVVLITTKSGKGVAKGKPVITLNSNLSFDVISVMPDLQTEFAQGSGGAYDPTASTSYGPAISKLADDPGYGGNTVNDYTSELGKHAGKYYVPQLAKAGLDPWATPRSYKNAEKFFKTGVTSSNSANISQNFEKGNYSFTLGNTKSEGIVPSTGLNRYNAKMAAEAQLNSNWSTGFTGNYVASKITKQSSANNGVVATVFPAPPSYDLAGIPSHIKEDLYKQNTYRSTSGFDGAYWAVDNNSFTERSQRFFGNAFLKYSTKLNTDNQKLDIKYQLGDDSYTTDYSDIWGYGHSNATGEIYQYGFTVNEMNSLLTAAYSWKISDKLSFDALLGNELVDTKKKYYNEYGKDFNFSGWNHMNNASVYNSSESYTKHRTVGFFGNMSLAYDNMLFLNVTGRNDVVSSMPRNNRSFFYPSVSLGWIFTELDAVKNNILTYGKLRASYAEVGQAGEYVESHYSTPTYGGGFSSGTPLLYPIGTIVAFTPNKTVYDPKLKPQNTKSYEIGADLAFLNGLVSVNYTFSRQNVKDQIFDVPLAGSTGSSLLRTNGGSIHTNAHEFSVSVAPIKRNNFKWDFAFNFTKIDNYVDELAPGVNSIFLGGFTEPQIRAGIGYKFPVIYGVSYLRNSEGKIIVDSKGLPQTGEEKVIGTVSPDFQLGFNNTFEIYKFRISALIDWKSGGQMYGGTAGMLNFYGVSKKSVDFRKKDFFYCEGDAVKVTGTDANGKSTYAPNDIKISGANAQTYFSRLSDISESMIYDNSFVKLREISVSYPVWNKRGITVNVNAFARNILLWSELKGLDPEAAQGNTNMAGAFERFSLPGTSSYGFGINIKF
ncbi:SusC/RagA family TonB-linked outer membrane protein [uncultured Acetobacteroides sp.]|uniref:SusC/RagA family TonB-linked outer membrane protein n=1 Tax=uncultured Acetobacteroides sp. TaxID=1760811 RepID=UPI0029F575F5|nr:SusC/RagA family TonB-linked outer membrane protein [uncultured Acetobacteroides sp.]